MNVENRFRTLGCLMLAALLAYAVYGAPQARKGAATGKRTVEHSIEQLAPTAPMSARLG